MNGSSVIKKINRGNIAINKLKAIAPALDVNAPCTMPIMYNSNRSYNDQSELEESLIF